MYEDLRERALINLEKKKKKVKAMQIVGAVFGSIAVFLYCISFLMDKADRPYMLIPIGVLTLIYFIVYTAVMGLPFIDSDDITEEDIEYEIAKVYRRYKNSELTDMSDEEHLELKQIEIMMRDGEDYV